MEEASTIYQKKRPPYSGSLFYEGAKRWSFGNLISMVIQEIGK